MQRTAQVGNYKSDSREANEPENTRGPMQRQRWLIWSCWLCSHAKHADSPPWLVLNSLHINKKSAEDGGEKSPPPPQRSSKVFFTHSSGQPKALPVGLWGAYVHTPTANWKIKGEGAARLSPPLQGLPSVLCAAEGAFYLSLSRSFPPPRSLSTFINLLENL